MSGAHSGKRCVLQLAPVGPMADGLLAEEFAAPRLWEMEDADAWLKAHGQDVDVLVTTVRAGCDATLIGKLPRLRAICSWGVGYDTIDMGAATARNIPVSTTPDVLDDCVADLAWALMLATARQIPAANQYVHDGHWQQLGKFPLSTRVSGKHLGILGLGRIGRAIAKRGDGFSMQVAYYGRKPQADTPYRFKSSLVELAEWADFLVVACPGGAKTHHLVSAEVIRALGTKGFLINIARGTVVDTQALIDALDKQQLGGAGLDVVEGEPGIPETLRHRKEVVFTPHIGSATFETREAMERLVVDNVRSFLDHGRLVTPVAGGT